MTRLHVDVLLLIFNCIECFYVNDEPESKFLYTETIKLYCIKTAFYSSKIILSTTCKELFSVTNWLMNKANRTPPLSSVSTDKLPQMFSYFFCEKVSTIQHNINSIMVGHGTLPGYRLKNLMCVMVHCWVTG